LTSLASLCISLGVLIGYSLGALFYWPIVAIICALIPLVSVALTLNYLPETPTWYLTKKRKEEARDALRAVRDPARSAFAIKRELDHLGGVLDSAPDWSQWRELMKVSSLKPLALVSFYFFTYQFSGTYLLLFMCLFSILISNILNIINFVHDHRVVSLLIMCMFAKLLKKLTKHI